MWSATQVITAIKVKMLYVEPELRPAATGEARRVDIETRQRKDAVAQRDRRTAAAEGRAQGLDNGLDGVQLPGLRDGAYGLIGWLIGRAVHVSLLFPVGMLVGLAISIGFIIYRYGVQEAVTQPQTSAKAQKEMTGDR